MSTAPHLAPDRCYVCGRPEAEHANTPQQVERRGYGQITGHDFWSNADAEAEFKAQDRRTSARYSNGTTTPEANYVAQHPPLLRT